MPPLALLAGGLATRLGDIAKCVPKSLIKVAGEPFVAHQLRLLARQGIADVVICCGHRGEEIAEFVGDGARFGCRVRYSFDGKDGGLLGTGGAILKALPRLGPRFWVMYGDSYLTAAFAPALRAFEASGKTALMTVFRNDGRWDTSNVEFADGRIVRYSKGARGPAMRHIDYGLGIYSADAFAGWDVLRSFDLALVQSELTAIGQMAGFEVTERFYEIGSVAGLVETNGFLREQPLVGAGAGV
jgi:NDP-sugar pyrophosphorylase family protein